MLVCIGNNEKKKQINLFYFTYFDMILDIKQTLRYKLAIEQI